MGQSTPIKSRKRISRAARASLSSFEVRILQAAKDLEEMAWRLPPGPERDAMLRRARQMDVANHMNEWLSSPGLQPPK